MPTMSSYELKVTALLKEGADPTKAAQATADFMGIFPAPTPGGSAWTDKFLLPADTKLTQPVTVEDEGWVLMKGSVLEPGTLLKHGSIFNGSPVKTDMTLAAQAVVMDPTTLAAGSIIAKDSVLKNDPWTVWLWRAAAEDTPEWESSGSSGQPQPAGRYGLLSFHGAVGTIRRGALGQQWARQTAPDDLAWFYKYRKTEWFLSMLAALIAFNAQWEDILEEEARVRDLKWYCGNGSGP
jgi:hypothetical protein